MLENYLTENKPDLLVPLSLKWKQLLAVREKNFIAHLRVRRVGSCAELSMKANKDNRCWQAPYLLKF